MQKIELYQKNGENALLGAGIGSSIQPLSCTPNLKRLWLNNEKMTPQKVNDLTVAVKKTKINNRKNRQETREKSKSMMMMKFCFNYVSFKTWLA